MEEEIVINLNDKIPGAPNFKYKEFIKSDTAKRLGIYNIPNQRQWNNIEELAKNNLQPIRDKFGRVRITSGFRSSELNMIIGGSIFSNHCIGEASDIEPVDDIPLIVMIEWVYNNLQFRELIAEFFPDGWIHIGYRIGENIKKLKLKDEEHNYQEVTLDYLKSLYPDT